MTSLEQVKETIKERVDLAAIIGKHTKLVKTARGFKACCPLPGHKEKTPSFNVDTQKNYFYCYGCNRGGDVFTFLQLVENLPFIDALRELAAAMNIELPKQSASSVAEKSERDAGFEILDRAAKYYHRVLKEAATEGARQALAYLQSRQISEEEIDSLQLGWSPETGDALARKISKAPDLDIALKAGLIREYEGSWKGDFFRNRLMVPITDHRGRVIGFSGRTLAEVTGKNPKYINSSESLWFKKKAVVYGLDRASKYIRAENYVCIVEGYFDQWALHRHEIPAVAVMGTALTDEHLELIGRYSKQVILVLDTDAAGVASTKKSLPPLLDRQWDVRVFSGFEGKDPDEWLKDNREQISQIKSRLTTATEGLEWLAKVTLQEATQEKLNRLQVLRRLKNVWTLAKSQAQKTIMADEIAPMLGLSREEIRSAMDDLPIEPQGPAPTPVRVPNQTVSSRFVPVRPKNLRERWTEEAFVWWLWHWDELCPRSEQEWKKRVEMFKDTAAESCVSDLFAQWLVGGPGAPPAALTLNCLEKWLDSEKTDETLRRWILKGHVRPESALMSSSSEDSVKALNSFNELATHLHREKIHDEISKLQSEMRGLRSDDKTTAQLLQKVQDLRLSLENKK